ncbi:MAG: hypothetical protein OXR67_14310 [Chloroflexota bacterium]|nr:hypothetical protein [Chloroflexota bacterium]
MSPWLTIPNAKCGRRPHPSDNRASYHWRITKYLTVVEAAAQARLEGDEHFRGTIRSAREAGATLPGIADVAVIAEATVRHWLDDNRYSQPTRV